MIFSNGIIYIHINLYIHSFTNQNISNTKHAHTTLFFTDNFIYYHHHDHHRDRQQKENEKRKEKASLGGIYNIHHRVEKKAGNLANNQTNKQP